MGSFNSNIYNQLGKSGSKYLFHQTKCCQQDTGRICMLREHSLSLFLSLFQANWSNCDLALSTCDCWRQHSLFCFHLLLFFSTHSFFCTYGNMLKTPFPWTQDNFLALAYFFFHLECSVHVQLIMKAVSMDEMIQ